MNQQRVGIYAWGGPGTLRLLRTKYFSPRIDETSFLSLYEPETLQYFRDTYGVTDAWVTFSWGFSDEQEAEDRAFILEKLPNFQKLGIRTHAYVQGLNLVTDDFRSQDPFCRDWRGRHIPYSKGRSFTCPNNAAARNIIIDRVRAAAHLPFDGVFVDNLLFGLPPVTLRQDYLSFCGCSCVHCQNSFQKIFGYPLPLAQKKSESVVRDYLRFRTQSVHSLVGDLSNIARTNNKEFGANLFDPVSHTPEALYGYSLPTLNTHLDYLLLENHHFPQKSRNNSGVSQLAHQHQKPVFVVSYKKGISFDAEYSPADYHQLLAEGQTLGYSPCLKATEFFTRGQWHAARTQACNIKPTYSPPLSTVSSRAKRLKRARRTDYVLTPVLQSLLTTVARWNAQSHFFARLLYRMRLQSLAYRRSSLYPDLARLLNSEQ